MIDLFVQFMYMCTFTKNDLFPDHAGATIPVGGQSTQRTQPRLD